MKKILKNNNFLKGSMSYVLCSMFLVFFPVLAFAANTTIDDLIILVATWLGLLVYIVIGVAVILFFWGIIKYVIAGAGNEEGRQQGKNLILYGIIGLFVMVCIWGLVYLLAGALGLDTSGAAPSVTLPDNGIVPNGNSTLITLIGKIGGWISRIAVLLIGIAMLLFLWGVARYIASGADEEKRIEARRVMTYGVVGLFAMISIWGLVYFVGSAFGIDVTKVGTTPQIENLNIGNIGINGQNVTITGTAMTSCEDWANTKSFKSFVCLILKIFKPIPPILVALAALYFFWGVAKYMNSGGDAEKLQNGRMTIIYGVLGMTVLVVVWGLVYLLQSELLLT